MARDATTGGASGPPPEDFIEFVARRAPGLRRAAHGLSGNDRLAESMVDDLLTSTAARWRWLSFTEQRMGRQHAADTYLDRIFVREAADWAGGRHLGTLSTGETLAAAAAAELAGYYWHRGARTRRRRRFAAAGIAAVLLIGLCAAPRGGGGPNVEEPPQQQLPAALPPLVDVLPAFEDQARLPRRETALPAEIGLDPGRVDGWLTAGLIRRALAAFLAEAATPMVIGDNGSIYRVDLGDLAETDILARSGPSALTSSSLSPDGTRLALLGTNSVIVADLTTAKVSRFPARDANTAVVWLTPATLLMAGPSQAFVLDPRTGASAPTTVDARNTLTVHGDKRPAPPPGTVPVSPPPTAAPGSRAPGTESGLPVALEEQVVELLPVGEPATAPARIRRYVRVAADVASQVVAALSGETTGWLGPWRGPGFVIDGATGHAVRDCDTTELALPERYGRARLATVVVRPATGRVERTLVASTDATTLQSSMVLGFLDQQTALIRTSDDGTQNLLAWRLTDGELRLVSMVNRDATVSVADIAAGQPR